MNLEKLHYLRQQKLQTKTFLKPLKLSNLAAFKIIKI
jgi:hypothetical protein